MPSQSFSSNTHFFTALALSNLLLGTAAGPLTAKRQENDYEGNASASASASASSTSNVSVTPTSAVASSSLQTGTTSSIQSRASAALVEQTLSDGSIMTVKVLLQPTGVDTSTTALVTTTPSPTTTYTSRTGQPEPLRTLFPSCVGDDKARPFCRPFDRSTLYVGKTYYVA